MDPFTSVSSVSIQLQIRKARQLTAAASYPGPTACSCLLGSASATQAGFEVNSIQPTDKIQCES